MGCILSFGYQKIGYHRFFCDFFSFIFYNQYPTGKTKSITQNCHYVINHFFSYFIGLCAQHEYFFLVKNNIFTGLYYVYNQINWNITLSVSLECCRLSVRMWEKNFFLSVKKEFIEMSYKHIKHHVMLIVLHIKVNSLRDFLLT